MKIAIVVWDLSISGGTQRQVLELAHYLVGKGHVVKVYCAYLNRSRCYPGRLEGLEISAMREGDYSRGRDNLRKWIAYPPEPMFAGEAKALSEAMDEDFDLVNPHDFQAYRAAYFYKRAHGTPAVWMVNDLPRSMVLPGLGLRPRKMLDLVHYVLLGGPLGFCVDRARIRLMDRSVVFDRPSAELLRRRTGLEPVRMGSGLDPSAFTFRPRSGCSGERAIKALAVGIFFPHRRFEDLLRAAELLAGEGYDVTVSLVGSEAYEPNYARRIHSLVSELGLESRVRFLGEVAEPELKRLYSESDVLVFPNYPQTWGLAVFEAMASGTPVIVSTGAGSSELLTDGENALLVPPGRPDEIASCMKRLCGDAQLYSKLSTNGRRFVEESVSWDSYGRRMEALFEEVVAGNRRKREGSG